MSWIDVVQHRVRLLFGRGRIAQEMDDEMRFHLDLEAMHSRSTVEGADEAEAIARKRFGNAMAIRDDRRRESGLAALDRVRQDAAYALRQLSRSPGFAIAVALTLALGIGANAIMFAIVDRVMLRAPEAIADPDRVVQVRQWNQMRNGVVDSSASMSYPSFMDFRGMTDVFERVTAIRGPIDMPVDRGPDATNARGALVADDYFQTLGVRPALGRFFTVSETRETAGANVVVLGYGYWQRRYGGAADVPGRTLLIDGNLHTIIGVAPSGFAGNTLSATDLWVPIAAAPGLTYVGTDWASQRGSRFLTVIARFKENTNPAQALARLSIGWTAWNIRPDRPGARAPHPYFVSLIPAKSSSRPEHRVARMLLAVAGLLLLITCANVANLLLARALSRRREIAIRLALGVSRARLTTLLLADAMLLALLGGAGALFVARWGIPLVRSVLFAGDSTADWGIDGRLVAFTMLIALGAGALAGIVPALQSSRPSLLGALRQGTREGTVHRSRTRLALLVAQGSLSVALLAGTGLFVRSLQRIGAQHLGLDLDRVLVADFQVRRDSYTPEQLRGVYDAMQLRARALPGVESTSLTVGVPFEGQYALTLKIPGHDSIPGMERGRAPFLYAVTADFFQTMGTRIVSGRGFREADDRGPSVAVVNAQMARLIWPGGDAIGQCFKIVLRAKTPDCIQIIGIAEDARRDGLLETPSPQYYVPVPQAPTMMSELTLLVRATEPRRVRAALSRSLQSLQPDLPYVKVRSLEEAVAPELRPWRLGAFIFALFGALALVVAAVGTYSVMQFSVSQRGHELGVRIALGARPGHVLRMLTSEALRIGALACVAGVLVVLATGPLVANLLFRTSPRDPVVLAVVALVLMVSGFLATLLPAWRATRVDPLVALKAE